MIVKIFNSRFLGLILAENDYVSPDIMNNADEFIYDNVANIERNPVRDEWFRSTNGDRDNNYRSTHEKLGDFDTSHVRITLRDGTQINHHANADIYVCGDDGKTLERFKHEVRFYPHIEAPLIPVDVNLNT